MRMLCGLLALLLCLCPLLSARADGTWYVFTLKTVPEALKGVTVSDYTGTITLSFLGDCTLGGEKRVQASRNSFTQTVKREGLDHPLRNLLPILAADDVTVVNLEGVLSDKKLTRVKKTFNFQGDTSFAQVLTLGSVELCNLANNHIRDYGEKGYRETRETLEAAGLAYFSDEHVAVWERDGVRIGFTGSLFTLSTGAKKALADKAQLLRELGCDVIIHTMHAGEEYADAPNSQQRSVAKAAAEAGVDLVVGHHPHVVQGLEWVDGVPVVYSLGNAVFGGNSDPRDYDAMLLQACFTFENGVRTSDAELRFLPISVSSTQERNNYQPTLLEGEDAERVLRKMEATTGTALPRE